MTICKTMTIDSSADYSELANWHYGAPRPACIPPVIFWRHFPQSRLQKGESPQYEASRLLAYARKHGMITPKEICESCGIKPAKKGRAGLAAHHPDYRRPLWIRWLCRSCHAKEHRIGHWFKTRRPKTPRSQRCPHCLKMIVFSIT